MKWFKTRHNDNNDPDKDKLAKGIVMYLLKVQTVFAKFMNKKAETISSSSMKVLLIVFLLSGSALSIYFIAAAIIEKKQLNAVKVDRLNVPKYYDKDGTDSIQHDFLITEREHAKMQSFKVYMDSMRKTNERVYDSIMLYRPRLMDSINRLEKLYQSQHKK